MCVGGGGSLSLLRRLLGRGSGCLSGLSPGLVPQTCREMGCPNFGKSGMGRGGPNDEAGLRLIRHDGSQPASGGLQKEPRTYLDALEL